MFKLVVGLYSFKQLPCARNLAKCFMCSMSNVILKLGRLSFILTFQMRSLKLKEIK